MGLMEQSQREVRIAELEAEVERLKFAIDVAIIELQNGGPRERVANILLNSRTPGTESDDWQAKYEALLDHITNKGETDGND